MAGLHFEEFHADQAFDHPWSRTVTEMDNTVFSLLTMNPQPLHIDAHFAEGTEWGQRLFNSLYTLGFLAGMTVNDTVLGNTVAKLGMTDVNFTKQPVFHGDTLRARTRVATVRDTKSRSDIRLVVFEHTCLNQRGEVVATCRRSDMMKRKPAA